MNGLLSGFASESSRCNEFPIAVDVERIILTLLSI
jgi:hypothetical protein